mmetsp:Transcript_76039/g.211306  ORF Transcript_76039/g.211306 Transcript_76039/m.211306 type:complete len:216 (-) Transcript_76039:109-756(-)
MPSSAARPPTISCTTMSTRGKATRPEWPSITVIKLARPAWQTILRAAAATSGNTSTAVVCLAPARAHICAKRASRPVPKSRTNFPPATAFAIALLYWLTLCTSRPIRSYIALSNPTENAPLTFSAYSGEMPDPTILASTLDGGHASHKSSAACALLHEGEVLLAAVEGSTDTGETEIVVGSGTGFDATGVGNETTAFGGNRTSECIGITGGGAAM